MENRTQRSNRGLAAVLENRRDLVLVQRMVYGVVVAAHDDAEARRSAAHSEALHASRRGGLRTRW